MFLSALEQDERYDVVFQLNFAAQMVDCASDLVMCLTGQLH